MCIALADQGNEPATTQPNILLLISDDQRFDQTGYTPTVNHEIARRGISYSRAYVTTPLCCPSRAGIYTGQYNGRNGVRGNNYLLKGNTIFKDFKDTYYLGLIGKYLNSHDGTPLPEFNYWVVQPHGHTGFFRQRLNVNGEFQNFKGKHYSMRIADFAEDFISKATTQDKPWFLTCAFFSPHAPAQPDPRDIGRFDDEEIVPRKSQFVLGRNKPKYVRRKPIRNDETFRGLQRSQRDTLYSMDRGIKRILKELKKRNQLDNTIIIYLSDNGLMFGEHFLSSKGAPYEEAVRVPMYIRYDQGIRRKGTYKHIVGNIDLSATLYELAGLTPTHKIDGTSLVPTFSSAAPVRDHLLLEGWTLRTSKRPNWYALHTDRYVLIHNENDLSEFYDLRKDPFQLKNVFKTARQKSRVQSMDEILKQLVLDVRGTLDFDAPEGERPQRDGGGRLGRGKGGDDRLLSQNPYLFD